MNSPPFIYYESNNAVLCKKNRIHQEISAFVYITEMYEIIEPKTRATVKKLTEAVNFAKTLMPRLVSGSPQAVSMSSIPPNPLRTGQPGSFDDVLTSPLQTLVIRCIFSSLPTSYYGFIIISDQYIVVHSRGSMLLLPISQGLVMTPKYARFWHTDCTARSQLTPVEREHRQ